MIYAREILAQGPAAVVFEVKCSQNLARDVERHGGRPVMWKTGHSLIKEKMKAEHAAIAGEMSGHIFFADDYFGFDDAVYASLRLLRILAASGRPLSALLADVPQTFSTPEIRVDCPDERKFEVVAALAAGFAAGRDVIDIDGVRVNYADGWGLLRASNTQPVLVMRFESTSPEGLSAIRDEFVGALARFPFVRVPLACSTGRWGGLFAPAALRRRAACAAYTSRLRAPIARCLARTQESAPDRPVQPRLSSQSGSLRLPGRSASGLAKGWRGGSSLAQSPLPALSKGGYRPLPALALGSPGRFTSCGPRAQLH